MERPSRPTPAPPRMIRMCGDAKPAETADVLDDCGRFTAKGIRGRLRIERDVVAAVCADFDGIEAEHAAQVDGRIRRLSTVAMVAENGELQAGASRRSRDVRLRSGSVRARCVNVIGATQRSASQLNVDTIERNPDRTWRQRRDEEKKDGGQGGRRHQDKLLHRRATAPRPPSARWPCPSAPR